jgi:hypothetical protein
VNGGYDSSYRQLVARLPRCNFEEAARRLGLSYADDAVRVGFLGRPYRITTEGVEPLDGQPVNVNVRSVLLYYLLSKGQGAAGDSYVLLEAIPRRITGLSSTGGLMSAPLERHFGNDLVRFGEAAAGLGGVRERPESGQHAWTFAVLPRIRMKLVFQEADEDFPAAIQVMVDEAALRFLEFECLAFTTGCLVRALIKTSEPGDVVGGGH